MSVRVVVLTEVAPGEARVALTPEVIPRLIKGGFEIAVQAGAGAAAGYPDADYAKAGAKVEADGAALLASAAVIVKLQPPTLGEVTGMAPGTVVVAVMNPGRNLDRIAKMRDQKVTSFALELLPRITRAQSMDVLSSQATVAGYQAVLFGVQPLPEVPPDADDRRRHRSARPRSSSSGRASPASWRSQPRSGWARS